MVGLVFSVACERCSELRRSANSCHRGLPSGYLWVPVPITGAFGVTFHRSRCEFISEGAPHLPQRFRVDLKGHAKNQISQVVTVTVQSDAHGLGFVPQETVKQGATA
jgi:hypothetical protein